MKHVILLHAGSPSERLLQYLQEIEAKVIQLADYDGQEKLTHILTTGNQDFAGISNAYHTVEDDVRIVSLTTVSNLPAFLASNGRLVWDASWEEGDLGRVWMEKFFQGAASVHLDETFPEAKEGGHFTVMNIFKTGVELDKMTAFVHSRGDAVVSVRTFVDHAFYYLTYLHQAGVAQLPFAVDYGSAGGDTMVQIHLPVDGFVAENMLESFSSVDSHEAQRFVLGVCARSADFMEIQYIQHAAKLVISGYWRKSESRRPRGLMLNHIQTSTQVKRGVERLIKQGVTPAEVREKPLEGELPRVVLVEEAKENLPEAVTTLKGSQAEKEHTQTISGGTPEVEESRKIAGGPAEKEASQTVRGLKEQQDKHVQTIAGQIEEELQKQVLKGEKIKPDDFVMRISQGSAGNDGKGDWKVRAGMSSSEANQKMKGHLQTFATNIGKTSETLENEDYQQFSRDVLPRALKDISDVSIITSEEQERLVQEAMKRTGQFGKQAAPVDPAQLMLRDKLSKTEAENAKMKSLLDAAKSELRVLKDVQKQMQSAEVDIVPETEALTEVMSVDSKMKMMQDLAAGRANEMDAQKFRLALEREQKTLEAAKAAENELRKSKLEIKQKENFYAKELEKTQRAVKSRDLVVEKAKESLQMMLAKKDAEIADLNSKIMGLSGLQATAQQAFQEGKKLEQEKQSLARMVEIYKNKLASVSANMEKQAAVPTGKKDEEVRRAVMDRQRVESALRIAEKELSKAKSKAGVDAQELNRLRSEKKEVEDKLIETSSELAAKMRGPVIQDLSGKVRELESEIQAQAGKIQRSELAAKELEQKLAEATANLARNGSSPAELAMKTKMTHLENTVKKLTTDVTNAANQMAESKKEVNKLRSEKTALQNQLDKIKKDADKAAKKAA